MKGVNVLRLKFGIVGKYLQMVIKRELILGWQRLVNGYGPKYRGRLWLIFIF